MTERATRADLDRQLERLNGHVRALGLLYDERETVALDIGSKTYGRAYRLWLKIEGSSAHHSLPISDYLGMTAREALDSLHRINEALGWVQYAQEVKARQAS